MPTTAAASDRRTAVVLAVILIAIALLSPVGPSGDSIEYVALARQIASSQRVTFSPAEAAAAGVAEPAFVGADGRQDLWHFWFYPALVSPLVAITDRIGVDVHRTFAIANALLLFAAAIVALRLVGFFWTLVFVAGPVIWWLPRAQVEAFTFSGIAAGCALLPRQPALAALAFGVTSTQNPPVAFAMILAVARAIVLRSLSRRDGLCMVSGFAFAVLHPAYYWWHLGRLTPLLGAAEWRLPPLRSVLSPLLDLNFGLIWTAPVAAAMLGFAMAKRSPLALRLLLITIGATFLVAFAQAPNVNHGGTPSLSRYALWLIPLPLTVLSAAAPSPRSVAAAFSAVTILWTALFFRTSIPESHLRPSKLAEWCWQNHPAWDNPLPEVFAERLRHSEPAYAVAATANCAKVITTGGTWPISCPSVPVPEDCAEAGAICYANRRGDGAYDFVLVPRR